MFSFSFTSSFKDTPLGPLPEVWDVVPLQKVTLKTNTKDPRNTPNEPFRYIDVSSVSNEKFSLVGWKDYMGKDAPSRARKVVKTGDIVFATVRPYLKNIAKIPGEFDNQICSTGYCVIRANEKVVDANYLFYVALSESFVSNIVAHQRGSSYPAVSDEVVFNTPIPLPPLPEQRAIARVLTTVREAIEATDRVLIAARELKRSLMHHLFTYGPVPVKEADRVVLKETEIGEVPEGWEVAKVGDIADIHSGGTPSRSKPEYWNGNIPWVKTGEIHYETINSTEETISEDGFQNSSAKLIPAGTLLMAMYGQGVTRGKVAILGIDATINQACAAFFLNGNVTPKFLFYLFMHHYERIRKMGHGAQQTNLSGTLIKTIPIAFPSPLEEQNQIVSILSDLDRKIQVESQRKTALETLFQSLLHHLMTGSVRVNNI